MNIGLFSIYKGRFFSKPFTLAHGLSILCTVVFTFLSLEKSNGEPLKCSAFFLFTQNHENTFKFQTQNYKYSQVNIPNPTNLQVSIKSTLKFFSSILSDSLMSQLKIAKNNKVHLFTSLITSRSNKHLLWFKSLGLFKELTINLKDPQNLQDQLNELIHYTQTQSSIVEVIIGKEKRIVFSPSHFKNILERTLSVDTLNDATFRSIEAYYIEALSSIELFLKQAHLNDSSIASEFYISLIVLNSIQSRYKDYLLTSNYDSLIPKKEILSFLQKNEPSQRLLALNKNSIDSLESLSNSDLILYLILLQENLLIDSTKITLIEFKKRPINHLNQTVNQPFKRSTIKFSFWNLNNFILKSDLIDYNKNRSLDAPYTPKNNFQLARIKQVIETSNSDFLVLTEVNLASLKKFVKNELNSSYKIIEINNPRKGQRGDLDSLFTTLLLVKSDLPIRVETIAHTIINGVDLQHTLYEHTLYNNKIEKINNEGNPEMKLKLFTAHMKSLHNNGEPKNLQELDAARILFEETQQKNPDLPILILADMNNNLSKQKIHERALGFDFKSLRDQNENTGENPTHISFLNTPHDSNSKDLAIKFTEIDTISGNKPASSHQEKSKKTLHSIHPDIVDENGSFNLPKNFNERDSLFPSDHLFISSTFYPSLLGF